MTTSASPGHTSRVGDQLGDQLALGANADPRAQDTFGDACDAWLARGRTAPRTTAGPAYAGPPLGLLRRGCRYFITNAAPASTGAHFGFVRVLHGPGLSVLPFPRTVTVTVCWPGGRASFAQATRAGCTVGEYRSTTSGLPPSIWTCARPRSGPSVLTQAALPLTVNCTRSTMVAWPEPAVQRTVPP